MKKTLLMLCLALGLGMLLGSCQQEIPNIEYVNVVNHTSDFSGLIAAIGDQSKSMTEKLDLIKTAINNSTTTLSEKLELIKSLEEALVQEMNDDTLTLAEKLADVEAAIQTGFVEEKKAINAMSTAISNAIDEQTEAQVDAMEALKQAVDEGFVSMTDATAALQEALVKELHKDTRTIAWKLEAVKNAINNGFVLEHATLEQLGAQLIAQLKASTLTLSDKIAALTTAVGLGFGADALAISNLKTALIDALVGNNKYSISKKLDMLVSINGNLGNINGSLGDINTSIGNIDSVLVDINTAINAIDTDFKAAFGAEFSEKLLTLLGELKDAVEDGADYSEIIAAIKSLAGITTGPITLFIGEEEITEAIEAKVDGEVLTVELKTLGKWAIDMESVSLPEGWSVAPAAGEGNTTLTVIVSRNETAKAKDGGVTFKSGEYTANLSIKQAEPWISAYPGDVVKFVAKDAEPYNVGVSSNASWTVECTDEWITATKTEDGTAVTVSVADNPGGARRGTITFRVNDEVYKTIAVSQAEKEYGSIGVKFQVDIYDFRSNVNLIAEAATGQHGTVLVKSDQKWRATTDENWIEVPNGWQDATKSSVISFKVDKNSGSGRRGTITLTTEGGATATITVTQY